MDNKPDKSGNDFNPQHKNVSPQPVMPVAKPKTNKGLIIALIILVLAVAAAGVSSI
ncbi:MAG: hypothetical protein AAFO69_09755 [Bacteroidota bacterium]